MDLESVREESLYAIVSTGCTIKLLFGAGCGDSMVYTDTSAVSRYNNLNPGFVYGLHLFKKKAGKRYKFSKIENKFVPVEN